MKESIANKFSAAQTFGIAIVMLAMLAQTRLWPSAIGRLGENVGDSVYVLTFPLLGLLSLGLLLVSRNKGEKINIPILGMVFVGWIFITVLWSLNPGLTIDASITTLGVLFLGVMAGNVLTLRNLQLAIIYSSSIGLIASLLLLSIAPSVVLQVPAEGLAGGVNGVYLHKNYFGFVMAITALCSYLLKDIRLYLRFSLVALFVIATLISNASNAIGGMILGFAIILFYQLLGVLTPKPRKIFIGTSITAILLLIVGYVAAPAQYFAIIGRNPDFTGRTKIWANSWSWAEKQPIIGYGWGTDTIWSVPTPISESVSNGSGFSVSHSHNSIIELILESGIIGALLILGIIISTIVISILWLKNNPIQTIDFGPLLIISLLSAIVVMGLFEVPLVQERGLFLVLTLAAASAKYMPPKGNHSLKLFAAL